MYLGRDIHTGELVCLSPDAMLRGVYSIGKPGTGKTTLIDILINQVINLGGGVCLLDPHRDLTDSVLSRIPQEREKDVILLDLVDKEYVPGLNLFQCENPNDKDEVSHILSSVMDIFAKLFTENGDLLKEAPTMAETLQNVIPVLLSHQNPRMTMAEIPLLLMDESARLKLLAPLSHPYVKNFWNTFNKWKPDRQEELTGSTRRRVGNFLIDSLILEIIGQSETTIPFRKIMDERKILLVKLSRQHELITSLVGSVIVAKIAQAAFSRSDIPEERRVQFSLFADEYQLFSTPTFAELLSEARKEKIATIVAHQFRDQIDKDNHGATLNAANTIVFQVSGKDADELAGNFDSTPPPPEIIGWRPILTPKSDVIDHLQKQGHVNTYVSSFVNDYLNPALRVVEANKRYYNVRVSPRLGEPKRKVLITDLSEAIEQLNTLLFSVMRDNSAEKPIPPLVFIMFARLFGFAQGFAWYFTRYGYFRNEQAPTLFRPKKELLFLCAPDFFSYTEEIAQKISPQRLSSALAFISSLRQVMQVLATDPILVNTGQHEPIYDKPRQYSDMQNETASTLANLPKYTAKVKLASDAEKPEEHTIRTTSPDDTNMVGATRQPRPPRLDGNALQERIKRIKAQNIHDGYLRKREAVEAEIATRQEALTRHDKRQQTKQDDED